MVAVISPHGRGDYVTDPNPAEFQCLKIIVLLPEETEVSVAAEAFVIVFPGGCSNADDFALVIPIHLPFDSLASYDCSDVGVQTFPCTSGIGDGTYDSR
jgi:hypothetical protein